MRNEILVNVQFRPLNKCQQPLSTCQAVLSSASPNYVTASKEGGPILLYPLAAIKQNLATQSSQSKLKKDPLIDMTLAFDSNTDWYFGQNNEPINDKYDFGCKYC